jgi:hypothetical protein
MREFLKNIWENKWSPFYFLNGDDKGSWIKYETPDVSLFGTSTGFWDSDYERTNFGKWVGNLPAFLALIFLFFYYVIFGTIWLIFFFIILNIIKVVIALFTKRWNKIW